MALDYRVYEVNTPYRSPDVPRSVERPDDRCVARRRPRRGAGGRLACFCRYCLDAARKEGVNIARARVTDSPSTDKNVGTNSEIAGVGSHSVIGQS
jgi:hypothetical protein